MSFFLGATLLFFSLFSERNTLASDFHSPRTAALGGAGHAGPLLNDSIFLNPSYSAFMPTYSVGLNLAKFSGTTRLVNGFVDQPHGRNYSVSVQDGRSDLFHAGVAYTVREDGTFVHVGAAKEAIQHLGFGISGKFFFGNRGLNSGKDLTFSTTGVLSDQIQTSLLVDNILETDAGKLRGLYREIVIGSKFNIKGIVIVYFDPHYTPSLATGKFGQETGLEFVLGNDFFLRMGMSKNATMPILNGARGRSYSVGVGWVAPRLSIDYAIERVIEPAQMTAHVFGATVYY